MTAPTLPDTLRRIAELAPDLIRFRPRAPLYPGGPQHGPLLFWCDSLAWQAGKHDCLACGNKETGELEVKPHDVGRLLQGLIVCCEARGWNWAAGCDAGNRPYASVMSTVRVRPPVFADTPAHALALALEAALSDSE